MKCENCNTEHDGSYGSGRFCSTKCARGFSTKEKREEINHRVSEKLNKPIVSIKCVRCNGIFLPTTKKKKLCTECYTHMKIEAGKKAYDTMIQNGNHNGWKSRLGKLPSYPEQYFIDLFTEENISNYTREYPVSKWFIDFAFADMKVAIEIDGKQHEHSDRKIKDKEKDSYLRANGWNVLRIKWHNPRTKKGKELLYPQIEKMKEILSVA